METQKKKFLYMDKFTKHQEEDQSWKKITTKILDGLISNDKRTTKLLILVIVLSVSALLIAIFK